MAQPHPSGPAVRPGAGFERPFVDGGGRWIGHDSGPLDRRYRVETPWARGRFPGAVGAGHLNRLGGFDAGRHRFWFGSSFFAIAPADWAYADNWSWPSDDVVLYDDPDHAGWYLAYNVRTGTYVHVQYDGPVQ
jgi:hypothetical protein